MPFGGGQPETMCGAGSTVANTTSVRAWLPGVLREFGIGTLLDAPCGDFNWMARTDLSGVDYIGVDYDREHCARAMSRTSDPFAYGPRSKVFFQLDLVKERLPRADLMLCREFLQHLPDAAVTAVLESFMASGIAWLLATSHDNAVNFDISKDGMFRPLNLMAKPWHFPPPRRAVGDQPGSGRILGLWRRADLG